MTGSTAERKNTLDWFVGTLKAGVDPKGDLGDFTLSRHSCESESLIKVDSGCVIQHLWTG